MGRKHLQVIYLIRALYPRYTKKFYNSKIRRKYKHAETKQHAAKNQWANESVKEKNREYLKTNENVNTKIFQNLQDVEKEVLRGKFIAIQEYVK